MKRPAAQGIECPVSRDAGEPRAKIPFPERVGSGPELQENALREVLGRHRVPKHLQGDAVDEPVVRVVHGFKGRDISFAYPCHELVCLIHTFWLRPIRKAALDGSLSTNARLAAADALTSPGNPGDRLTVKRALLTQARSMPSERTGSRFLNRYSCNCDA